MIEPMIQEIKKNLPLTIEEVSWDGTVFNMYGESWGFSTLSAWRISDKNRMIIGCFDNEVKPFLAKIEKIKIIGVSFQNFELKIDPSFLLSNQQRIEIFSTDIFEPWTFHIDSFGTFVPTPAEPEAWDI